MIGTRLFLYFLGVNIVLMLAGFQVNVGGDLVGKTQDEGFSMNESSIDTGESVFEAPSTSFIGLIDMVISFFFGGGIIGLLVSAGMPWELQMIIGIPYFIIGVLAVASLLKGWI